MIGVLAAAWARRHRGRVELPGEDECERLLQKLQRLETAGEPLDLKTRLHLLKLVRRLRAYAAYIGWADDA